ncbi:MAG: M56 family metallopeptidase [Candidatus Latescibacterota bacterium]
MNAALNELGRELFDSFSLMSLELIVLALVILVADRTLKIKSPTLRHFLWLIVLLKPIVAIAITSPFTLFTPLNAALASNWLAVADSAMISSSEVLGLSGVAVSAIDEEMVRMPGWVAAFWILGVMLFLGRIVLGYALIWRLRLKAEVCCRGPLFEAMRKACLALDGAHVAVASSDSIRSPIVVGVLRPLILVPTDLVAKLHVDELELVLVHELAHVRRWDNLTLLVKRLITVAFFFHPVVWLCGVKLRREAEKACDDLVVFATGRSELYARSLMNVAELTYSKTHIKRRIPIMNVIAATESDLALRIRRTIKGDGSRMTMLNRFLSVVLLLGMAALTLPSSGIAQTRGGGEARTETKDEVDWEAVRSIAPEDWSDELKAQIVAAGHDLEAIAERVRQGQKTAWEKGGMSLEEIGRKIRTAVESGELTPEEGRAKYEAVRQRAEAGDGDKARKQRVWRAAMAQDPDEWSGELEAAILELKPDSTIQEIAEGIRKRQAAERIWRAAMAQDPDEWSAELEAAVLELKPDSTIEEIAEGIRQRQAHEADRRRVEAGNGDKAHEDRVWRAAMAQDPDDWSVELKAAILELKPDTTIEEIAEAVRQRQAHGAGEGIRGEGREKVGHRLREFQKGVIARAMALDPDEWPEELQAAIVWAGWNLEEFTEGVRQRLAGTDEPIELPQTAVNFNTNIEKSSWGEVKEGFSESR